MQQYYFSVFSTLVLGCLFSITTNAQVKNAVKILQKGDAEGAFSAFQQELNAEKIDEQVIAQFNIGKLYATEDFSQHNIDSAYHYLAMSELTQKKMSFDDRKKLSKIDENIRLLKKTKREVTKAAYERADAEASMAAYTHFLTMYEGSDITSENKITKKRNELAYKEAETMATAKAFEDLLNEYGASMRKKSAAVYKDSERRHFEYYMRENGWGSYEKFATKFPANVYVKDSTKIEFDTALKKNTLHAYKVFLQINPDCEYARVAVDSIAKHTLSSNSVEDYEFFVTKYPKHPEGAPVWAKFYDMNLQKHGKEGLMVFKYNYPDFPDKERLEKDLAQHNKNSEVDAWRKAKYDNNFESYHDYLQWFPKGPNFDNAINGMHSSILSDSLVNEYDYFVKSFPYHEKTDSMWMHLFRIYTKQNGERSVLAFDQVYPDFPHKDFLQKEQAIMREKIRASKTGGKK